MYGDIVREEILELRMNIDNMTFCVLTQKPSKHPEKAAYVSDYIQKELHTHPYSEVFACVRGSLTIRFNDYDVNLTPGYMLIVPPNVTHVLHHIEDNSVFGCMIFYCIQRHVRNSQNIYRLYKHLCIGSTPFLARDVPELCQSIRNITLNIGNNTADQSLLILHAADQIASFIKHGYECLSKQHENEVYSSGVTHAAKLDSLLHHQFDTHLNTSIAAKTLNLSPRQLDRISLQRYGITFTQALINRRVCVAAELLTKTQLPLEQIQESTGFKSYSAFVNNFKKVYSMTPLQYRLQHK